MNCTQFKEIQNIVDKANKDILNITTLVGIRIYFLGTDPKETSIKNEKAYQNLIDYIFNKHGIIRDDNSRKKNNRELRDIIYYILKFDFILTYEFIGLLFGKDHSTVLHNVHKVKDYIDVDTLEYKVILEDMRTFLKNI